MGRVAALVEHLPPDAAAAAAQRDDPPGAWPRTDQLLALLLESSDMGHRLFLKANTKKGTDVGEPLKIEWPGRAAAAPPKKRASTKAEIAAFLGRGRVKVIAGGAHES